MQVCTLLQTDNNASIPALSFSQAGCLPAAQPTVPKHCSINNDNNNDRLTAFDPGQPG